MSLGILPAGGDCPGVNAVIQAAGQSAQHQTATAVGIRRGYRGLVERDYVDLDARTIAALARNAMERHASRVTEPIQTAFIPPRLLRNLAP